MKLTSSAGSFFLREEYLEHTSFDFFSENRQLDETEEQDVLQAAFAFAAERDAVSFLSRAEQSSFLLRKKLLNKKHSEESINKAFIFLNRQNWLSDERYAGAFLRSRSITRSEGKTRLLAELSIRGISSAVAKKAVSDFFQLKPEMEILEKAVAKYRKRGKDGDELRKCLVRLGFSRKDINSFVKN